jgi:hypothetical protein
MRPEIPLLTDPTHEQALATMKKALRRSDLRGEPANRQERRRLNEALRRLGAPELQVSGTSRR